MIFLGSLDLQYFKASAEEPRLRYLVLCGLWRLYLFSLFAVRPSLRGSCPLDVAYSSLMDNNELALALRESHLEKIVAYLSRAGVQSNPELLAAGYPDIGWDPVEGERFLDFLRFCVWVNGT